MTKDVLTTISGTQMTDEEDPGVETIVGGDYHRKNGKHYIFYEEMMEGFIGKAKNVIKMSLSGTDIVKKGIANIHMQFEKNKKNLSCYTTSLDDMVVGIQTSRIKINEGPDSLLVSVDYSLDIDYKHLSNCSICLDVRFCPQ